MTTRAAAKREAALLEDSLAASLSSPPVIPIHDGIKNVNRMTIQTKSVSNATEASPGDGNPTDIQFPTPVPTMGGKRKRATPQVKKPKESVLGNWDVLPHGLGKKGDLLEDPGFDEQHPTETSVSPPKKRTRQGEAVKKTKDGGATIVKGVDDIKIEDLGDPNDRIVDEPTIVESPSPKDRGHTRATKSVTSADGRKTTDAVTLEVLDDLPKKGGRRAKSVKTEVNVDVKDEDFEDEKPKKKRAARKKKTAFDTSQDVLDNVDDLIAASGNVPKKERKKKANKYGLTPGVSPFPDHAMPTPEACEKVAQLLSKLHGEVKPPEKIPPPSMDVTGCGEVPDLLDAILRTLLSASTTANNANLSLKGLKDKFGLRESGTGKGSVNWEAVREADLLTVIDAIKRGGLAKSKGTNIKKILDAVYEQNCVRRNALLKEKETGEPAKIHGAKQETQEQKDMEIANADNNALSMDHVFELTNDEAMDEMTKLPGIGVKTASCVILFCMKRPSFAVDTHVWRHCKMLGWVPEKATRDQTFSHCEVRVPDHLKYALHQLFLKHGKTCGKCKANASVEEFDKAICPIEHLVTRKEKSSRPTTKPKVASGGKKRPKKGSEDDEAEDESDIEMEDALSTDGDDE